MRLLGRVGEERSALRAALAALDAAGGDPARADAAVDALARALGLEPGGVETARLPAETRTSAGESNSRAAAPRVRVVGRRATLLAVHVRLRRLRADAAVRAARRIRTRHASALHLFLLTESRGPRLTVLTFDLGGRPRQLTLEPGRPRDSDVEALERMIPRSGEGGVELAMRYARALDRTRLRRRFFRDFRAHRARIAADWIGLPEGLATERQRLALLLLCRLMFLRFLQDRGQLAGDRDYLATLARRPSRGGSIYRTVLSPLFFAALNARPETRGPEAARLGPLPYLNGGLFEPHALELRHRDLDLPDPTLGSVLDDLLDRYRFTSLDIGERADPESGDLGIDPEMLGMVFEELMESGRRGETGSFYTPAAAVADLVREGVAAYLGTTSDPASAARLAAERRAELAARVRSARVLDPACGSGAFLLGAMGCLARLRASLDGVSPADARRSLVERRLYGVDIQGDAALLCSLRLWLAIAVTSDGEPPPLPNLDRRIRQGDALLAPFDIAETATASAAPRVGDAQLLGALKRLVSLGEAYVAAGPAEREALRRRLAEAENDLARAWLASSERRRAAREADLRTLATSRDLFGEVPTVARRAVTALAALADEASDASDLRRALEESRSLPFFSFPIHFPEAAGGFDIIVSNPPWIRAARWPRALAPRLRRRYVEVVRGWKRGARLCATPGAATAQADLSVLFLQRCAELLAPGGVLALLLPAKVLRSLYGAGARRLLVERTELVSLHDHSLDAHAVFRADAFTVAVVARRPDRAEVGRAPSPVRVTLTRRGVPPLSFEAAPAELPVLTGDTESPWLLAPADARAAMRRMQRAGAPLGESRHVRRGIVTGANDVLLLRSVEPKLGGLAWVRPEGSRGRGGRVLVESEALAPLVRGGDVAAWSYEISGHVVWLRDDRARHRPAPPRLDRYLRRHAARLRARSGAAASPVGAVFRVTCDTLRPKVAWHDLAETLKAVALPASVRTSWGASRPLVPLNTTYFVPVDTEDEALLLSALLNSTPVRTFARAVAERAKDARFRFFAWTIALVPLPTGVFSSDAAPRLVALARQAHVDAGLDPADAAELDDRVCGLYGLSYSDRVALGVFDAWLRGTRS